MAQKIELIKICGIKDPKTALACVELGASHLGLVFFQKSPRYVSDKEAFAICQVLPDHIITTGVFVDNDFSFILDKIEKFSLKAVQLHGNESQELIADLRGKNIIVIKAIFVKRKPYFKNAYLYNHASYLLAEYGNGVLPGGNAEVWNFSNIEQIDTNLPIILAGGLDPTNINNVLNMINIAGVDVSSGVEFSPGIKDLDKVANFIHQVKAVQ
jgi:phosphoribosylanthranilate isomerase/indole-3-glycerol phosphate synthase/phosphoribosylanthranilate isomerase